MERVLTGGGRLPEEARLPALVNRYATPLAVLIVALGIVLAQPVGGARAACVALLCFGAVFNLVSGRWLAAPGAGGRGLLRLRVGTNLAVNAVLVYILGGAWPPVWLLLALTPFATAIYATRARTLAASAGVSVLLFAIAVARGHASPLEWGVQAADAAFIVLVSLMVNELSALARGSAPA